MATRYTFYRAYVGSRAHDPAALDRVTDPVLRLLGATNVQPAVVVATQTAAVGNWLQMARAAEQGVVLRPIVASDGTTTIPYCIDPSTDAATLADYSRLRGVSLNVAAAPWSRYLYRYPDGSASPNCPIVLEPPLDARSSVVFTYLSRTFDADLPPRPWPDSLWNELASATGSPQLANLRSRASWNSNPAWTPIRLADKALRAASEGNLVDSSNQYQELGGARAQGESLDLVAVSTGSAGGGFLWLALAAVVGVALMQRQKPGGTAGLGRTSPLLTASRLRKRAQRLRHEGKHRAARSLEKRANVIARSA